ncbi:MAG: Ig-like domain-containing protein, partial [bacterium]|nr:Ig-like domain-containing protein [bacterium]
MKRISILVAFFMCVSMLPAFAQYGIFDKTADWGPRGANKVAGSVSVSGSGDSAVYTIKGNGDDIWNNDDEGFFVYTELSGPKTVQGQVKWINAGPNEWAKIGVMIRDKAAVATSRTYNAIMRGLNGGDLSQTQWRLVEGGGSNSSQFSQPGGGAVANQNGILWLRTTRIPEINLCFSEWSFDGVTWTVGNANIVQMEDPVAYGIAITNHVDDTALAEGQVTGVKLLDPQATAAYRLMPSIPDVVYTPGQAYTVQIAVGGKPGATTVTETPPAGWAITNISDGGTASSGVITWNLASFSGAVTLSYTVTPPANANADVTFSGNVNSVGTYGGNRIPAAKPIGIFDNYMDVGAVGAAGKTELDGDMYIITASGADIWGTADEFHFLYKKLTGAFEFEALVFAYHDNSTNEWSKAGLMIRDKLTAGSKHLIALTRGSDLGNFVTDYRPTEGGESFDTGLKGSEATNGLMRLVRWGDVIRSYYFSNSAQNWVLDRAITVPMDDPVYVGVAVTSHDDGLFAIAEVEDVNLELYPFYANRTITDRFLKPGESTEVTVVLNAREEVGPNVAISEKYPAGTVISNLSASAGTATDNGNGTISWNVPGAKGAATMTYTLTVADTPAQDHGVLSGTYSDGKGFSGDLETLTVVYMSADDLSPFQGNQDIGNTGAQGFVGRDGDTWKVIGSGSDIWGTADNFHYLWLRATGDFRFSVENPYIGGWGPNAGANDWQKFGLMARQSLDANSAFAAGELRASDQAFFLQYRPSAGVDATWEESGALVGATTWNTNLTAAPAKPAFADYPLGGKITLAREGNFFSILYELDGEDFLQWEDEVVMTDP